MIKVNPFQDKTLPYAKKLRQKSISYLEERWGTKRLAIPENMVAPYMQMVKLPYLKSFCDDPVSWIVSYILYIFVLLLFLWFAIWKILVKQILNQHYPTL